MVITLLLIWKEFHYRIFYSFMLLVELFVDLALFWPAYLIFKKKFQDGPRSLDLSSVTPRHDRNSFLFVTFIEGIYIMTFLLSIIPIESINGKNIDFIAFTVGITLAGLNCCWCFFNSNKMVEAQIYFDRYNKEPLIKRFLYALILTGIWILLREYL